MKSSEKVKQIVDYLDKHYYISEDRFFTKYGDLHEWGQDIAKSLKDIFSFDEEFSESIFKYWCYFNNLPIEAFDDAWKASGLKNVWTPEMVQDLQAFHGIDVESELIAMVSAEVSAQIDRDILTNLFQLGQQPI